MFTTPEQHAANPPETWQVIRRSKRSWATVTQNGDVIEYHERKKDAEESLTSGPMHRLYQQEKRWYAGDTPTGWVPYDPAKHGKPITSPKGT